MKRLCSINELAEECVKSRTKQGTMVLCDEGVRRSTEGETKGGHEDGMRIEGGWADCDGCK